MASPELQPVLLIPNLSFKEMNVPVSYTETHKNITNISFSQLPSERGPTLNYKVNLDSRLRPVDDVFLDSDSTEVLYDDDVSQTFEDAPNCSHQTSSRDTIVSDYSGLVKQDNVYANEEFLQSSSDQMVVKSSSVTVDAIRPLSETGVGGDRIIVVEVKSELVDSVYEQTDSKMFTENEFVVYTDMDDSSADDTKDWVTGHKSSEVKAEGKGETSDALLELDGMKGCCHDSQQEEKGGEVGSSCHGNNKQFLDIKEEDGQVFRTSAIAAENEMSSTENEPSADGKSLSGVDITSTSKEIFGTAEGIEMDVEPPLPKQNAGHQYYKKCSDRNSKTNRDRKNKIRGDKRRCVTYSGSQYDHSYAIKRKRVCSETCFRTSPFDVTSFNKAETFKGEKYSDTYSVEVEEVNDNADIEIVKQKISQDPEQKYSDMNFNYWYHCSTCRMRFVMSRDRCRPDVINLEGFQCVDCRKTSHTLNLRRQQMLGEDKLSEETKTLKLQTAPNVTFFSKNEKIFSKNKKLVNVGCETCPPEMEEQKVVASPGDVQESMIDMPRQNMPVRYRAWFRCSNCKLRVLDMASLHKHTCDSAAGQLGEFLCVECGKTFGTYNLLKQHVLLCGDQTPNCVKELEKMLEEAEAESDGDLQCTLCNISFSCLSKCLLHFRYKHILEEPADGPFKCMVYGCIKQFRTVDALKQHYSNDHDMSYKKMPSNVKLTSGSNCMHFMCLICKKIYLRERTCLQHMKYHITDVRKNKDDASVKRMRATAVQGAIDTFLEMSSAQSESENGKEILRKKVKIKQSLEAQPRSTSETELSISPSATGLVKQVTEKNKKSIYLPYELSCNGDIHKYHMVLVTDQHDKKTVSFCCNHGNCTYSCSSVTDLWKHAKMHQPQIRFTCNQGDCRYTYFSMNSLVQHIRTAHSVN